MKALNLAKETLLDPHKRAEYDRKLKYRRMDNTREAESDNDHDRYVEEFIQKLTDEFLLKGKSLRYFTELNEFPLEILREFQSELESYQGKMKLSHADVIAEFSNCIKLKEKYGKDFWKVFKAAIAGNYRGVNASCCIYAGFDWDKYQKDFPVTRRFKIKFDNVLEKFEYEAQQIIEGVRRELINRLVRESKR